MDNKLKEILIWYYELNQPTVLRTLFDEQLSNLPANLTKELAKYFKFSTNEVTLKTEYTIGIIDVKKTIAFLLQEKKDLAIYLEELNGAMDKDLVLTITRGRDSMVLAVLKSSLSQIVCQVRITAKHTRFIPDKTYDRFINVSNIPPYLVDGHVVLLKVINITNNNITCEFDKIVGHINDPDIDILKIIYGYNWPLAFDDDILKEIEQIKIDQQYEKNSRRDLTSDLIVTIDGADAKDLDDAISITKEDNNYIVGVHIADVSYFVKDGTNLDNEAYRRATSVYLADRVIPMLPHGISNDLCSLNPNQDKYTITCQITLDQNFDVISHQIFPSIIKSKYRLTYDEVNQFINNGVLFEDQSLNTMLNMANEISLALKQKRTKRGAIDFVSSELKFEIDPKTNKVLSVSERVSDYAEGLIESLMILANETVATHFIENKLSGIYRVHEEPDLEKLDTALDTAAKLGFVTKRGQNSHKTLQILTQKSANTNFEYVIHMSLLRAMQKAKYLESPIGHFGLASKYYSHFTSPIRRYPDLLLHRMIRELIFNKPSNKTINYFKNIVGEYAKHSSDQERKAINMERDVVKLKSCDYMQDKVGQEFSGTIVSLTNSGLFVKLDNGIEGFIALKDVNSYLMYDEIQLSYFNDHGKKYRLGDKIEVKLINVNMIEKQISLTFAQPIKGRNHENTMSKQKSQPRLSDRRKNRGGNKTKRKRS